MYTHYVHVPMSVLLVNMYIICVVPSTVRDLTVHVNHTNVTATWSTPAEVNGELLFYKVKIYLHVVCS